MLTAIDALDRLIAGPTAEPISLTAVKSHLRWTSTAEDGLLNSWIAAARQHFEEQTGRQILTATWEYWLPYAPTATEIELPHPPLQAIESVTYDQSTSPAVELDATDYTMFAPAYPTCPRGRLVLNDGVSWPALGATPYPLRIRYRAGYLGGSPTDVPDLILAVLYLMVEHFHARRSDGFGMVIDAMLRNFKYSAMPTLQPRREVVTT